MKRTTNKSYSIPYEFRDWIKARADEQQRSESYILSNILAKHIEGEFHAGSQNVKNR